MVEDLGSNQRPILSDSERTKEVLPDYSNHTTLFKGYPLSWYTKDGATYTVAAGKDFTNLIEALKYLDSLPKRDCKPNKKALKKAVDALEACWNALDILKK